MQWFKASCGHWVTSKLSIDSQTGQCHECARLSRECTWHGCSRHAVRHGLCGHHWDQSRWVG